MGTWRFHTNGTLDTGFGGTGYVTAHSTLGYTSAGAPDTGFGTNGHANFGSITGGRLVRATHASCHTGNGAAASAPPSPNFPRRRSACRTLEVFSELATSSHSR